MSCNLSNFFSYQFFKSQITIDTLLVLLLTVKHILLLFEVAQRKVVAESVILAVDDGLAMELAVEGLKHGRDLLDEGCVFVLLVGSIVGISKGILVSTFFGFRMSQPFSDPFNSSIIVVASLFFPLGYRIVDSLYLILELVNSIGKFLLQLIFYALNPIHLDIHIKWHISEGPDHILDILIPDYCFEYHEEHPFA